MKLGDLKGNPRNPRRITDQEKAQLKASLDYFGDLGGIFYNVRTERLGGGHQRGGVLPPDTQIVIEHRYDTPNRVGTVANGYAIVDGERFSYREVDWPSDKEEAANVAANRLGGEDDEEKLGQVAADLDDELRKLAGITDDEMDRLAGTPPEGDPDAVPEPPKVAKTKRGELWILGEHRVLCGDATDRADVDRLMAGEKAALCFTSPPYADQREYGAGTDLSVQKIASFIRAAGGACDFFAVNLGISRKDGAVNPYWDDYITEAGNCGLNLLSWNVWDKAQAGGVGNQTAMFPIEHEWILVFGPRPTELNRTVPNKHAGTPLHGTVRESDGSLTPVAGRRSIGTHRPIGTVYRGDVARFTRAEEHRHPAMFPVHLPQTYIEAFTEAGGPVYEPFCGSGTTVIASEASGRRCFGMEIEPLYIDVILQRFADYAGVDPVREDGVKWSELR